MAAQVMGSQLLPAQAQEVVTIMDDYGTEYQLYIPVSNAANRQTLINAAIAQQSANEAALDAYASAHGIDLSAQLAAGAAIKAAWTNKG